VRLMLVPAQIARNLPQPKTASEGKPG
jgi:hypothetical protein